MKVLTMTTHTDSISLKIWDNSAIDHTIEAAIRDLTPRAAAENCGISVTLSGPKTFTVSLNR
ncbi:hypothetical protein IG195_11410 [Arthrobacter sp. TES]|nr:hypothetical protein AUT26_16410 [Arthrobacter sp. ATCC 21022]ERI36568.2 hypothetical protein M707_15920 [Arthrobacter sp. AK-YN10]MBN9130640.1 hypothetical protein [Paenarthrobacter ureafaciens]NKR12713.1 hypothetical protein [Arthrobacter sp. M5]NKR16178.1 hypothetical protein [Arthrobacter sp. M6]OEH59461.1 hypothetical protein A5N13_19630 [Arthrobacter sp. D4]OEH62209.1 hypothetical protein A5N17_12225 [Arthrobacter sp. D2]QOI62194.1 hypothetical protein IG195_11410 [Arthrobacter sp. 